MAGCTPKNIYDALIKAGFSTNQAIGAIANAMAESSLNAEARVVDSNGYYSDGLWQFNERSYPNAGSLVTGNCQADITNQVGFLKSVVSGQALAGSTAGEVAGNFARYFERCATCQPDQASYNQRVANSATVAGWVSSGHWPTSSAGLSGSGSGGGQAAAGGANGPDCAFGLPSINFHVTSTPQLCLLKKTTIRHMVGGSLLVAGGLISGLGVILLAAFAFRASGAQKAAAGIAGVVPGERAAVTVRSAAQRTSSTRAAPAPRAPREPSARTQQRRVTRAYRSPRSQSEVAHEPRRQRRRPDLGELQETSPEQHGVLGWAFPKQADHPACLASRPGPRAGHR